VPALVEILVAPEDDAAMGKSIDHVKEFEAVGDAVRDPLARMPELAG
jgi:glyoxylate carboligase